MNQPIRKALISVFHKDGIDAIAKKLHSENVELISTGGTQNYLENLGLPVTSVESLTGYPSILDGRVKTLHPKVFGGILAKREEDHLGQLQHYGIPGIDLVIVDLYPFEETVASTNDEAAIIEKIDIGGIALIRAAAKNYNDVVIVPSRSDYPTILQILSSGANSTLEERKQLAGRAFAVSSSYDRAIQNFFMGKEGVDLSFSSSQTLRYGENPHQEGRFYGKMEGLTKISGKELSYNNLVDVDAAVLLIKEFSSSQPTFAILKHTNPCGIATRDTVFNAWKAALAGDPISAFGGILITNSNVDIETAQAVDKIFYEVLIAPSFDQEALDLLTKKKKRILMTIDGFPTNQWQYKSVLGGLIGQQCDNQLELPEAWEVVTKQRPTEKQEEALLFALKCVKHLKSNTIVLARDNQLLGMGCGQTSRVDACKQAIDKAQRMGFSLEGAVMASDAFFPFPDCVQLAAEVGVSSVIQPGGSINDKASVEACNVGGMSMVITGKRHFRH